MTHKDIGTVSEVFRMSHSGKRDSLLTQYAGPAAIGHVRYATCGKDDRDYAQPFEQRHLETRKWFAFGFNGQITNYAELWAELSADGEYHLSRETDTEIVMHVLSRQFAAEGRPDLLTAMRGAARLLEGAYSLVLLNARGDLLAARDPLGIKPLCYARSGSLLALASESVALVNLGFARDSIVSLAPGHAIVIEDDRMRIERFAESPRHAHCFFEWVYFANVASTLDARSVYQARYALGVELARQERAEGVTVDESTIVVPVPDTSKAAADAMAFELKVPCREGLIRNRYTGRTFIESAAGRVQKVQAKFTPLREVLEGKRVLLVEDSIVRSTTMRVLIGRIREDGGAREIHVRVACPPIVAPCFYGIDMSTREELFAPRFIGEGPVDRAAERRMAEELGADTLRYLPIESLAQAIRLPGEDLCQACVTARYPTPDGQRLYQLSALQERQGRGGRTYEAAHSTGANDRTKACGT